MDGKLILAGAIVFTVLVGAWMFRYEQYRTGLHQNRFTGAICFVNEECWLSSNPKIAF